MQHAAFRREALSRSRIGVSIAAKGNAGFEVWRCWRSVTEKTLTAGLGPGRVKDRAIFPFSIRGGCRLPLAAASCCQLLLIAPGYELADGYQRCLDRCRQRRRRASIAVDLET